MKIKDEVVYARPLLRGVATSIDMFIAGFLRVIFAQLLGNLWVDGKIALFFQDFDSKFGIPISWDNYEHAQFFVNHEIKSVILMFAFLVFLVGLLYYSILNSSSWRATVGKRILGIAVAKNNGETLTFLQSMGHYLLSLVPWLFIVYILIYQVQERVTLYEAISGNMINVTLGLVAIAWVQVQIFNKKKNTIQDMLIDCSLVKEKGAKGFPRLSCFL
jgi:uncharacterized RDD family membrane protein YckC